MGIFRLVTVKNPKTSFFYISLDSSVVQFLGFVLTAIVIWAHFAPPSFAFINFQVCVSSIFTLRLTIYSIACRVQLDTKCLKPLSLHLNTIIYKIFISLKTLTLILDCGPPAPKFGTSNTTATTFGSLAEIGCDAGYIVSGDTIIICLSNGTWSSNTTCNPIGILHVTY